jgi:cytochrome P450
VSAVADQDLLSPELTEDPFAYYAELRASDPVHWAPASKAWLLTRYDDVVAAFGDPRLSSDRVRPLLDVLPAQRRAEYGPMLEIISRWMVVTDPPVHTRLNRLASRAFRQQRVSAMSGWIGALVDELLDDFVACGGDDFLAGLAYPLPAAVIARMMGVPQQDRGMFQHWSDELALVAFGAGGQDRAGRYARALAGVRELQEYLAGLIERRRREPGEDMISLLLGSAAGEGADEDSDHLDDAELMALCSLILFAGHETTTNLLCNTIVALDRHPAELTRLRADPSLVNRAVEEVLRFEGPIKILIRWVVEDHERDGRQVRAGDRVFLVLQSANRDQGTFADPDRFDMERPAKPLHVGFGRGVHACLGAQLARIEARAALPKILGRLGDIRVCGEVTWRPNIASRAVTRLRISYE